MAFASGNVSMQRFFLSGKPFDAADDRFMAMLNEYAFGRRGGSDPNVQSGWISGRHLFDHELTAEKIVFGRYVHLALRVDSLKVPGAVARSMMRMEEEAALQASGRAFLTKTEQRMAREAGKLRIEQETKSGAYRRIAAYPVLIDLEAGGVLLGNTGASAGERLIELFGNTFSRALLPADPDQLATRGLGADSRALEQLRPFYLTTPPDGYDADGLSLAGVQFLGREFLTWLWFLIDTQQTSALRLRSNDEVAIMIDRTLRLECAFGMTGADVITADAPAGLPEARSALAIGKLPTKAGLLLGSPAGEFGFALDGPRMTVTGLVLPEGERTDDPRAAIEQRFELCFDCLALLDTLYELFLRRRIRADWSQVQSEMSAWARGGQATLRRASA